MNVESRVVQAQAKIIDNLTHCEEAISRLYSTYSEIMSDDKDFWADLSEKEKVHADILRTMHRQLEKGNVFYNLGRFDDLEMSTFVGCINGSVDRAIDKSVTPLDAISMALTIESSILDAHFYDIVRSDAKEYRIIAKRLSSDTHDHVKDVQGMLMVVQAREAKCCAA